MSWLSSICRKFRSEERGAVLVEMTIITPLMISLSAGVFEFGNLIHKKLLIEAGLDDAARYVARCTDAFVGIDCVATARDIAAFGVVGGTTPRVAGWAASDVVINFFDTPNVVDAGTGLQDYRGTSANVRTVQVTTSFTYTGASLLAYLDMSPIVLSGSHQERFIGF